MGPVSERLHEHKRRWPRKSLRSRHVSWRSLAAQCSGPSRLGHPPAALLCLLLQLLHPGAQIALVLSCFLQ